jgi:hypothetical protein
VASCQPPERPFNDWQLGLQKKFGFTPENIVAAASP